MKSKKYFETYNIRKEIFILPTNFIEYVAQYLVMKIVEITDCVAQRSVLIPHKKVEDEYIAQPVKSKKVALQIEKLERQINKINLLFSTDQDIESPRVSMKHLDIISSKPLNNHFLAFSKTFDTKISYIVKHLRTVKDLQPSKAKTDTKPVVNHIDRIKQYLTDLLINTLTYEKQDNIEEILKVFRISEYTKPTKPKLSKKKSEQYIEYGKLLLNSTKLYTSLQAYWEDIYAIDPELAKYFDLLSAKCTNEGKRESIFKYITNCGKGGSGKAKRYEEGNHILEEEYDSIKNDDISTDAIYQHLASIFFGENVDYHPMYTPKKNNNRALKDKKAIIKVIKAFDKKNGIDRSHAKRKSKTKVNM